MIAWLRRFQRRVQDRFQDRRQDHRVHQQGMCGWNDCERPQAPYLVEEGGHWTLCQEHKKAALNGQLFNKLTHVADIMDKIDKRPKPED